MSDAMVLQDALAKGPGLDGYAFRADVLCVECGEDAVRRVFADRNGEPIPYPDCQNSETLPQPIFFGESDTAQHCGTCAEHLYGPAEEPEEWCNLCGRSGCNCASA